MESQVVVHSSLQVHHRTRCRRRQGLQHIDALDEGWRRKDSEWHVALPAVELRTGHADNSPDAVENIIWFGAWEIVIEL